MSNDNSLVSDLSTNKSLSSQKIISDDKTVKTLGLTWDYQEDVFQYTISVSENYRVTKRSILAISAQIFDPMGLIGPFVLKAKIILQMVWQLGLDWDESVPMDLHATWTHFYAQIPTLNKIKIPRHVLTLNPVSIELHGFSDASQKAYGACCYLKSVDVTGKVQVSLLCAKSRVAPLKTLSLPRLELCASLLLVKLVQRLSLTKN